MNENHFRILGWKQIIEYYGCIPSNELEFHFANPTTPLVLYFDQRILTLCARFERPVKPVSMIGFEASLVRYSVPLLKIDLHWRKMEYCLPVYVLRDYQRQYLRYSRIREVSNLNTGMVRISSQKVLDTQVQNIIGELIESKELLLAFIEKDSERLVLQPLYDACRYLYSTLLTATHYVHQNTKKHTSVTLKYASRLLDDAAIMIDRDTGIKIQ